MFCLLRAAALAVASQPVSDCVTDEVRDNGCDSQGENATSSVDEYVAETITLTRPEDMTEISVSDGNQDVSEDYISDRRAQCRKDLDDRYTS